MYVARPLMTMDSIIDTEENKNLQRYYSRSPPYLNASSRTDAIGNPNCTPCLIQSLIEQGVYRYMPQQLKSHWR